MPFISIIIPTLSSARTLSVALDSILQQSFNDFEILIMDGLSTDATLEIARSYNDDRVKIFSEKDNGIYDAMNKGIDLAKGEWIYFLGSDDTLYDENVFSSLSSILADSKIEIVYGNAILKISGKKYDGEFNRIKLLKKNICHQTILTHKTVFSKLGKFDISYKTLADWQFNMKWFNNKRIKHLYIESIIACYSEIGSSFRESDKKFYLDWDYNTHKYFSKIFMFLYKHSENLIAKKLLKVL